MKYAAIANENPIAGRTCVPAVTVLCVNRYARRIAVNWRDVLHIPTLHNHILLHLCEASILGAIRIPYLPIVTTSASPSPAPPSHSKSKLTFAINGRVLVVPVGRAIDGSKNVASFKTNISAVAVFRVDF